MNETLSLPIIVDVLAFAFWVAVSGAGVCAVVLAAALLLGRHSAPLGYSLLMGGVVGLLAIPALVGVSRSLPATLLWPLEQPDEEVLRVPVERLGELLGRAPVDAPVAEAVPLASEIFALALLVVWTLGMAIGLGRLLRALWKRSRALIGQPWQPDFWTAELRARLARKLGLAIFPDVLLSPTVPMPMVLGFRRPTIVLPEQAPASWGEPQWEAILLHEAAHIARRDPWAVLAQTCAAILFWWCPLVHLLNRRLNVLRESICDDYALQGPCDHIAYAEVLIESAERLLSLRSVPAPLALLDSARGGLEARVSRLLEKERSPMTKLSLPGKLGAAFLVGACLLATAATAFSGGQPQPQKKIQIKIIVDGKEIDLGDLQLGEQVDAAPNKEAVVTEKTDVLFKLKPTAQTEKSVADLLFKVKPIAQNVAAGVSWMPVDGMWKHATQVATAQAKSDPRIDDLVERAEAIKPGSGAAIRNALESVQMSGDKNVQGAARVLLKELKATQPDRRVLGELVINELGGKKVIILLEDGTVRQLQEQDLKNMMEKHIRLTVRDEKKAPVPTETKKEQPNTSASQPKRYAVQSKTVDVNNVISSTDMEALRRQLDRLSAEVQVLKQRLDDNKK